MLRILDIPYQDTTSVTFTTEEIVTEDTVAYVLYDTSTGATTLEDYYTWRTFTHTSTGMPNAVSFSISNSTLFPKFGPSISDYSILNKYLFYVLTSFEQAILKRVIDRVDLARKRLPNPGTIIEDVDGMGDRGVVSVAGGYFKKFSISELLGYIEGTLVEINIHPPATNFYWTFASNDSERINNPYLREYSGGVPYNLSDLIVQGTMIRALIGWGILEVDLNFVTSDAGLQVTYDKIGPVQSWMDRLLAEYSKQKVLIKWNFANHHGVGIGSLPYAATGIWGTAMSMIEHSGIMPLTSMLGFNLRTNVPL